MDSFLDELAQPRPDPGGGAAAAYGARLALALLAKVIHLESRRRRKAATKPDFAWAESLPRLQQLAANLVQSQADDVLAYSELAAALRSGEHLAAATRRAVEPPQKIIRCASEALELLAAAARHCKPHLLADLLVACEFLGAALAGAYHIACANLPLLAPADQALRHDLRQACQQGENLFHQARAALLAREGGCAGCRG